MFVLKFGWFWFEVILKKFCSRVINKEIEWMVLFVFLWYLINFWICDEVNLSEGFKFLIMVIDLIIVDVYEEVFLIG